MERRPAVGSKCGVGILHVCQVKDHHQERSDNNIDCSPSHLAHYIKKTVTVRFILDHPVDIERAKMVYGLTWALASINRKSDISKERQNSKEQHIKRESDKIKRAEYQNSSKIKRAKYQKSSKIKRAKYQKRDTI